MPYFAPVHSLVSALIISLLTFSYIAPRFVYAASALPPQQIEVMPGSQMSLFAGQKPAFTKILRRLPQGEQLRPVATITPGAVIEVQYAGFSPEARMAFDYAVNSWAALLKSPVPIIVAANWIPLGPYVLGSAAPYLVANFADAPVRDTWYPVTLANKLSNQDLLPDYVDITVNLSDAAPWYFGTDGQTPSNAYDLVSVAMHELGHGLGFSGSMTVQDGQGKWGINGLPLIYDRLVIDGAGQRLLDADLFPNPSNELGLRLQSNDLMCGGREAAQADPSGAQLFAPTAWRSGSSYSHLDENKYPPGNPNSLMSPQIDPAEAIHDPGPVVLAVLRDLGWDTIIPLPSPTQTPTATSQPSPTPRPTDTASPTPTATQVGTTATRAPTATASPTKGGGFHPLDDAFQLYLPMVSR